MLGCGHGLEGREPWRSGVASSDVTLTLDLVARVVYIILLLDDYVQKRNPAPRARFRFQIWALFGPNPLALLDLRVVCVTPLVCNRGRLRCVTDT